MDRPDRRIGKTRAALFGAFSDLLREKSYASITIQEIIDRANVGRTTFYQHFPDKDALLVGCIESIFEALNKHLSENVSHQEDAVSSPWRKYSRTSGRIAA
jgi:AcrR family transcriptional regulator